MKKIRKGYIFSFLLGAIIFGGIVGVSAYTIFANDIGYTPKDTTWKKSNGEDITNVKDAIDELHSKADQKMILIKDNLSGQATVDVDVKPFYDNYEELTSDDFILILTNMGWANSGSSGEAYPSVSYNSNTGIATVTPGYMGWGGKKCSAWNIVSLYLIKN